MTNLQEEQKPRLGRPPKTNEFRKLLATAPLPVARIAMALNCKAEAASGNLVLATWLRVPTSEHCDEGHFSGYEQDGIITIEHIDRYSAWSDAENGVVRVATTRGEALRRLDFIKADLIHEDPEVRRSAEEVRLAQVEIIAKCDEEEERYKELRETVNKVTWTCEVEV